MAPSAILLRLSFLASERQRRVQEIELLHARTIRLRTRIEEIDREKEMMNRALEGATEPLSSSRALPVSRAASSARTQGRFAIRY